MSDDLQELSFPGDTSATASSSPKVSYSFEDGTDNNIRLTKTTYPDGRVIVTVYGAASGMDEILSRPSAVKDNAENLEFAARSFLFLGRTSVE
ncbi:MAG: hypothetical protein ACJAVK_000599 [Akkermansiaceae bacterium]